MGDLDLLRRVFLGWTLLSFVLIHAGAIPLNAAQIAYFDSLGTLDYVFSVGIGLANFLGAISLFLLRRMAFHLFASALVANLLMTLWHVFSKVGWQGYRSRSLRQSRP
jgi:hypothetical protein